MAVINNENMGAEEKILRILDMISESRKVTPEGNLSEIYADQIDEIMRRQEHEQIFKKLENELNALEIHTRPNYISDFCYRLYIKPDFNDVYNRYKKIAGQSLPEVYYNGITGVGYANGHRFKFKRTKPEFSVFQELYNRVSQYVPRQRVLELIGYSEKELGNLNAAFDKEKRKPSSHVSATYLINDTAKEIRKRTKLNNDYLVIDDGGMLLAAKKLANPP